MNCNSFHHLFPPLKSYSFALNCFKLVVLVRRNSQPLLGFICSAVFQHRIVQILCFVYLVCVLIYSIFGYSYRRHRHHRPVLHWAQRFLWVVLPSPPSPATPAASSRCQTWPAPKINWKDKFDTLNSLQHSFMARACKRKRACRSLRSFSKRSLSDVSVSSSCDADSLVLLSSASSANKSAIWTEWQTLWVRKGGKEGGWHGASWTNWKRN